jgi:hypothetical protein
MELLGLLAQPHGSPRAAPQPQQRIPGSLLDYSGGTGALRCPDPAAEQAGGLVTGVRCRFAVACMPAEGWGRLQAASCAAVRTSSSV